jgi:hypothetical protein
MTSFDIEALVRSRQGGFAEFCATDYASVKQKFKFRACDLARFQIYESHEVAMLKPLVNQDHARSIVTERLALLAMVAKEHEEIAIEKSCLHLFADEHRKAIKSRAQVNVLRKNKNAVSGAKPDTHARHPR